MKYKIFIDGREGATGLKIFERFSARPELELVEIDPDMRKDVRSRLHCMSEADLTFLCLPDDASREIVAATETAGVKTRVIDTSTAFRTSKDWVYGMPELEPGRRALIASADRVAAPGCHATGFILIARPLISEGIVGADYPFTCHSITGFSGGGKQMIADYGRRSLPAPRQYGITQTHKHLPEMQAASGATSPILFNPTVANYYSGMLVTVPLHGFLFMKKAGPQELYEMYRDYYGDCPMIKTVAPGEESQDGFLQADALADRNELELLFYGNSERVVVAARFDNLGKGSSGTAMQCMNIMLGLPETAGLI
jgi:N-acetyl-gamma-glutamyl-phosphate reductase